jgi:hypothetical protein
MEPHDLNSLPSDDAQLEAWLRASSSLPPIADHGFTARVIATLPAPAAQRSTRRTWFCLAGAFVGLVVAGLKISSGPDFTANVPAITPDAALALKQLADPSFLLAMGVTAASLMFAFWPDVRRLMRG